MMASCERSFVVLPTLAKSVVVPKERRLDIEEESGM